MQRARSSTAADGRAKGGAAFFLIPLGIRSKLERGYGPVMTDSIQRLHSAVRSRRDRDPTASRTAKLLKAGPLKVAKKVGEEAAEVALEAATGNRREVVRESADLLYHLVVLWVETGVSPREIWAEMDRRERLLGIAEKPPKSGHAARPIPLERARQRRAR